ncbi:MAG: MarR family winged helix-turn-helix transcriptional regulator [Beijerinckiaceae bacterium]
MAKAGADDRIGQALTLAARRLRARHAEMLSEIGLFPGQDQVLKALLAQDGLAMGEIAAMLSIRPPTASKMAARMGAQGLVERRSSSEDARLVTIHITEEGRALADRMDRIARKLEKRMLADMDEKDERRFRRFLKRAARNLGPADDAEAHEAAAEPVDSEDA